MLTGLLPMASSACFLLCYTGQPALGWHSACHSINQENVPQTYPQASPMDTVTPDYDKLEKTKPKRQQTLTSSEFTVRASG